MTLLQSPTPIRVDQPETVRSIIRKYTQPTPELQAAFRAASPEAMGALRRLDTKRFQRGQRPYTAPQTAIGLRAASRGESTVGDPQTGLIGGLARNIGDFTRAIPQLPAALIREVMEVPNLPESLAEGFAEADTPLEAFGNVAAAPGIRMLPGTYIASRFGSEGFEGWAGGGASDLYNNPLFTGLDVLPFASAGAGSTATVRAARTAARDATLAGKPARRVGRFGTNLRYARLRGGPQFAENPLLPDRFGGSMVPNPIGAQLERFGRWQRGTRLGNIAARTFGGDSKHLVRNVIREQAQATDPRLAVDDIDKLFPMTQQVADQAGKQFGVDSIRAAELYRIMTRGDEATITRLPDNEQAWIRTYDETQAEVLAPNLADPDMTVGEAIRSNKLFEVDFTTPAGTTTREILPPRVAKRVVDRRANTYRAGRLIAARDLARTGTLEPADAQRLITEALEDPSLTHGIRMETVRGVSAALTRAGFDGDDLARATRIRGGAEAQRAAVTDFDLSTLPRLATTNLDDIASSVASMARRGTRGQATNARLFTNAFRAGRWADAAKAARDLSKIANVDQYVGREQLVTAARQLQRQHRAEGLATRIHRRGGNERTLTLMERSQTRAELSAAPDRFSELIADGIRDRLSAEIAERQAAGTLTPDEGARAMETLTAGLVADLPESLQSAARNISREVASSWQQMVDANLNPRWVHRVTERQVKALPEPRASDTLRTPSSLKDRVLDFSPSIEQPFVALTHQAAEFMSRVISERVVASTSQNFSISGPAMRETLRQRAVAKHARNPHLTVEAHLHRLVTREFAAWDTVKGIHAEGRAANPMTSEYLIPRAVADNLRELIPSETGMFARTWDPVMNVFRTALLPLSPRWHIYNFFGTGIMTAMESPASFVHLPRAFMESWRELKGSAATRPLSELTPGNVRTAAELSAVSRAMPPMGGGTARMRQQHQWARPQGPQLLRKVAMNTKRGKAVAAMDYAAGATYRRLWDEVGDNLVHQHRRGQLDEATFMRRMVARSYWANNFVDEVFRFSTWRANYNKMKRRGASEAEAIAEGVTISRRIQQNWDDLTPIERTTMRSTMPFYSWAQHLLRFVSRYPLDHPWRMNVMMNLADREIEDFGTGLPQRYMSTFFMPGVGEDGKTLGINLNGLNPFRDVASYANLIGFLAPEGLGGQPTGDVRAVTSQLAPHLSLFLQAVGVDPQRGMPDPYADVTYDPVSGGLGIKQDFNPLLEVPSAIIPQSRTLADLIGLNDDFRDLVERDPDAARSRVLSGVGVPALARRIDVPGETFKAEVRRWEELQRTRSNALRTGNLGQLDRFPALSPLKDQLEQAKRQGLLDPYTPPQGAGLGDVLAP